MLLRPTLIGFPNNWNPNDKSASIALSNASLTAASTTAALAGSRGSAYRTAGKYYFEAVFDAVGTSYPQIGIADGSWSLSSYLGSDAHGISLGQDGFGRFSGTAPFSGAGTLSAGGFACVALDLDNKRFWARAGTGNWNASGTANPATNTGGVDISAMSVSSGIFLGVGFNASGQQVTLRLTGGFGGAVPAGFYLMV